MKKLMLVIIVVVMCLSLAGCGSDYSGDYDASPEWGGTEDNTTGSGTTDVPSGGVDDYTLDRLIMYTVDISLEADDIDVVYQLIKDSMSSGEWCDSEYIRTSYISLTVRVESSRLDDFIDAISDGDVEITSYSKTAEDISSEYYDIESRVNTLTIEQTTLNTLLESGGISLSDTLAIVERLSEIQGTLDVLNGELASYDSLVQYSTVNIYIYGVGETPAEIALGEKLGSTFVSAWTAVCDVFEFMLIAIVAIVPFLVIIVPVGVGVFFIVRHVRKKKKAQRSVGEPVVQDDTQDN